MEYYQIWHSVYIHILALFVIYVIICMHTNFYTNNNIQIPIPGKIYNIALIIFTVIMIGMMPVSWNEYPSDRFVYTDFFNEYRMNGSRSNPSNDIGFEFFQKISAKLVSVGIWFAITGFIYVFNHYRFVKKTFPEYISLFLIIFFSSTFFYAYGTNTIRAGLAASFLILSLSFDKKSIKKYIAMTIAVSIHLSMLIPVLALIVTQFYKNTKIYFVIWLISIIISYFLPDYFSIFFANILNNDNRANTYLLSNDMSVYNTGFRLDFLIFSMIFILLGLYFKYKKKFNSSFFSYLLNTYIIVNSFWVLNIRALYSDRFAYLSWFIFPIIIIYPFIYSENVRNRKLKISLIILMNFSITYLFYIIKISK
jgi:hypothetical protein